MIASPLMIMVWMVFSFKLSRFWVELMSFQCLEICNLSKIWFWLDANPGQDTSSPCSTLERKDWAPNVIRFTSISNESPVLKITKPIFKFRNSILSLFFNRNFCIRNYDKNLEVFKSISGSYLGWRDDSGPYLHRKIMCVFRLYRFFRFFFCRSGL